MLFDNRKPRSPPRPKMSPNDTMQQASQSAARGRSGKPNASNQQEACMLYVGLDVHQKRSSMCILNSDGKVVKQELVNGPWPRLFERLERIDQPFSVCYEASCGYGHLYDRIAPLPMARHVSVAHPGQLRLIFKSKKKPDRVAAQKIAKLLYLDAVPPVHVPNIDVRSWRKLIEFRGQGSALPDRS